MAQSAGTVKQPVRLPGMESNCEFRVISSVNAAGEDCLVYHLEICSAVGQTVNICLSQGLTPVHLVA